jgi:hypothetical protein
MPPTKDDAARKQSSTLTDADRRLIDFLVKQAIKEAMKSCS